MKSKTLQKTPKEKQVQPDYSNIKGTGWNYFKTPTSKDTFEYKKGFNKGVNKTPLKQYPSPTSSEIKGYNEAKKRKLKTGGLVKSKKK